MPDDASTPRSEIALRCLRFAPGLRRATRRASRVACHLAGLFAVIALTVPASGCSAQQWYGAGQAWQKNECNRIADPQERNRCMSSTQTSYEDYKRQSEAARGAR